MIRVVHTLQRPASDYNLGGPIAQSQYRRQIFNVSSLGEDDVDVDKFIADIELDNAAFYGALPENETVYWTEPLNGLKAAEALKPRWFNEWRIGVDIIGRFVEKVDDIPLKILLSKQIGDEGRHARLIDGRIRAYGSSTKDYSPPAEQLEFADLLLSFQYPEEFFAAEQLTIETQSVRRNELAIGRFDHETSHMFEHKINPDERFHVKIGYIGLQRYAVTQAAQDRARRAVEAVRDVHRRMVSHHNRRMATLAA